MSILASLLSCICFWLLTVHTAVEFLNTFVVCAIFASLSLGTIWCEDAIVYMLSSNKGMLNSISFEIYNGYISLLKRFRIHIFHIFQIFGVEEMLNNPNFTT